MTGHANGDYVRHVCWCQKHGCAAEIFDDGGVRCMYLLVVESGSDDCVPVPVPAERLFRRVGFDMRCEECRRLTVAESERTGVHLSVLDPIACPAHNGSSVQGDSK